MPTDGGNLTTTPTKSNDIWNSIASRRRRLRCRLTVAKNGAGGDDLELLSCVARENYGRLFLDVIDGVQTTNKTRASGSSRIIVLPYVVAQVCLCSR